MYFSQHALYMRLDSDPLAHTSRNEMQQTPTTHHSNHNSTLYSLQGTYHHQQIQCVLPGTSSTLTQRNGTPATQGNSTQRIASHCARVLAGTNFKIPEGGGGRREIMGMRIVVSLLSFISTFAHSLVFVLGFETYYSFFDILMS